MAREGGSRCSTIRRYGRQVANLSPAEYPSRLYVFVDRSNFVTANNIAVTGVFTSADPLLLGRDNLPFVPNPEFGGGLTPFLSRTISEYRVEYDAELARRRHAPDAPSRLTAVYAFGDEESCRVAVGRHGWDPSEVQVFTLVPGTALRVRRVNMEIVSLARAVYHRAAWSHDDIDALWRAYWQGAEDFAVEMPTPRGHESKRSGCLWEYLIEGAIRLVPPGA